MAVTIANVKRNHRGVYFEATGDGSTTALTVNHMNGVHSGTTATAANCSVITAPTSFHNGKSGSGGFVFPFGTPVAISSVSVTSTAVTVNTGSAIGNGTVAYCVVVFDQYTATN